MTLADALAALPSAGLTETAARLRDGYRGGETPVIADERTARAYALYRMPATSAAVATALREAGPLSPRSMVDLGGGTGAGAWAAAEAYPSLAEVAVVDRSAAQLAVGRRLAASGPPVLQRASWRQEPLGPVAADLVVLAYVLTETDDVTVLDGVDAGTVVVVEPGTPAGYARMLAARDVLLRKGFHVLAPCPHDGPCAMTGGWCHLPTRVERSAAHRRLKDASLGYEDERASYVVASRTPRADRAARVVGRPRYRKRLVNLELCTPAGPVVHEAVGASSPDYRAARDVGWGQEWRGAIRSRP